MKSLLKAKGLLCSIIVILIVSTSFNLTAFAAVPEAPLQAASQINNVPDGYVGIYTTGDLNSIRDNLSGNYILMNDIMFTSSDFSEGGNFYNDGKGWLSIGISSSSAFSGFFDGNGYKISGIQINETINQTLGGEPVIAGLFGYNKGTIKNLGMTDGTISLTLMDSVKEAYVGAIAGYNDFSGGVVTNCYNSCNVNLNTEYSIYDNEEANFYLGGVVGYNYGGGLTNCYNTGNVSALVTIHVRATSKNGASGLYFLDIGGIAGDSLVADIQNCYNTGNVNANLKGISYDYNFSNVFQDASNSMYTAIGGTVGKSFQDFQIANCYNSGEITATTKGDIASSLVGGIIGSTYYSNINKCYNMNTVNGSAINEYGDYGQAIAAVGGIVGDNDNQNYNIENCYNIGNISTQNAEYGSVGGIVGDNNGILLNCYNIGELFIPLDENDTEGNVIGKSVAGGIIGLANSNVNVITNCYYLGTAETDTFEGTTFKSANQFENGEVAWLLNTGGKNIGEEGYIHSGIWSVCNLKPVFSDSDFKTIYKVAISGDLNTTRYVMSGVRMGILDDGYAFVANGQPFDPNTQIITFDLEVIATSIPITTIMLTVITTANDLASQYIGCTINAYDKNGNQIDNGIYLGTGMEVEIISGGQSVRKTIILIGDINGDGRITIADRDLIRAVLSGSPEPEGVYFRAADIHRNGIIDAIDAFKISQLISKQP